MTSHQSIQSFADHGQIMELQAQSGSQTPTTPSMSQRKLHIFRKGSHYAGLSRMSKSTILEKNASLESINKLRHESTTESKEKERAEASAGGGAKAEELHYYPRELSAMSRYLKQHVLSLFAAPFGALAKGLMVMDEKQLERMFPLCWELLLVDDEEVASTTAVLCVVCSVKISKFVTDCLRKGMNHEEAEERVDSILKFQALWRYRCQVWIRLDDGAQAIMRVSHALNIDYTLPSPLIGRPYVDCPDAPWLPPTSIKIEEVAISQEEQSKNSNTLVAATQTRRKQLQESMNKALRAQEERNQRERERVKVSMLPVLKMAAIEPVPHQVADEREVEVDENGKIADTGTVATHTLTSLPVFPTALGTAILQLVDLLDDVGVDNCGIFDRPSVDGISFKEIKTILRREQCDAHLLLTANVPGAKKVIVHGPDLTQIPRRSRQRGHPVQELLTEALDFFSISTNDGRIIFYVTSAREGAPSQWVRARCVLLPKELLSATEPDAVAGDGGLLKLQLQAYHNLFLEAQKVFLVHSLFLSAQECDACQVPGVTVRVRVSGD
ncbi:protein unc-80-like [Paramacrobiotus metropolitanus]|uniref:protein unc-80-like n=1 Tax=Paramacrobiotus metropolitanus TaxID=2943436 RepID=UPI0024461195|nr:protein unc-80-like [Paramacrobiotus metropolitanus]